MTLERSFKLNDEQWDTLLLRCPKLEARDRGVFEAVLWVLISALPWGDLDGSPTGRTAQTRYHRWVDCGEWPQLLESFLSTLLPLEAEQWRGRLERAALLRRVRTGRSKRLVLALP